MIVLLSLVVLVGLLVWAKSRLMREIDEAVTWSEPRDEEK